MSSSQKRSHRNSVQNGPIGKFTALTVTTFVTISVFMSRGPQVAPDPKKVVVIKRFAPKFCAEWSDREIHSSHGGNFHDNFYVYVSGQLSGNIRATFGQLLTDLLSARSTFNERFGTVCVWDLLLTRSTSNESTFIERSVS